MSSGKIAAILDRTVPAVTEKLRNIGHMKREARLPTPKNVWTDEEDKLLFQLHSQGVSSAEAAAAFPNRSQTAVTYRRARMERRLKYGQIISTGSQPTKGEEGEDVRGG
jgi:hypothetical protein